MVADRKPRVELTVEQVIEYVEAHGIVTVSQVADAFDVHVGTARRKLDGGVWRRKLWQDKYDPQGVRLHHELYRYCINDDDAQQAQEERAVLGGYPGGFS